MSLVHGAFAQFYRNDLAAYCSIELYRRFNPDSPIVLLSDAGDDLKLLAEKFNCSYSYETKNIGTFRNRHSLTDQYDRLKRVRVACDQMSPDWIVILEPDVETQRAPSSVPKHVLCGGRGVEWSAPLREMLFGITGNPNLVRYNGCGGSVFNRRTFMECFDSTPFGLFERAYTLDWRIKVAEDACMSFLFQVNGHTVGIWEDFTGCGVKDRTPFAFVHGDKKWYGKPSPLCL